MPSGPPAFLTFIDLRSPCTRSNVITGKDIGHLRREGGGRGMPESSRVELEENRRPKRLAFSVGEFAKEPSDRIRGGKVDLQKLLEMLLARGQKDLLVGEPRRLAHFRLMKAHFARRRVSLQRFLCLLYTSDAADERSSVDLGGRRI